MELATKCRKFDTEFHQGKHSIEQLQKVDDAYAFFLDSIEITDTESTEIRIRELLAALEPNSKKLD